MIHIDKFLKKHELSLIEKSFCYEYSNNKLSVNEELKQFITKYGGNSYAKGLFRIHTIGSCFLWTDIVSQYFSSYKNKFTLFGYDWTGRQFGVSNIPFDKKIYMFDHAVGKVYELDLSITGFFNEDLVDFVDDTLATDIFDSLSPIVLNGIKMKDCIAFKIPLFLGGTDEISNYELFDMLVNWEINYQLFCKVKNLTHGQLIDKITIAKEPHIFNNSKSEN